MSLGWNRNLRRVRERGTNAERYIGTTGIVNGSVLRWATISTLLAFSRITEGEVNPHVSINHNFVSLEFADSVHIHEH